MAYISLFRKYRSENFEDLVGQEHIVRTISNSIKSGKIGQGYLFCGTRGTGKTTVARIIAKALNCVNGPTDTPCGVCEACVGIKNGNCIDVYEMDAASNRGVDDVEAIVESVKYRPSQFRYKVYIIDEAHQLSNQAKDAFLKTLEEPPEYVVFILATTEAHKIPVTIRSRCQQFDFRRGSVEDISGRLLYVANSENVVISPEAVNIIARSANGSYRDSLSILEQIISFTGTNISQNDVFSVLGLVEKDVLFGISKSIVNNDIKSAFTYADDLINKGKDIKEVLSSIASFYRDLLAVKINAEERTKEYKEAASEYTEKNLIDIINIFVNAQKDLRFSEQQRLCFELAFMQAANSMAVKEPVYYQQPTGQVEVAKAPATRARIINDSKPVQIKEEVKPKEKANIQRPEVDLENFRKNWRRIMEYIRAGLRKAQLSACAVAGVPTNYENGVLTVTFKHDLAFHKGVCEQEKKTLEKVLFDCYKFPITLNLELFVAPVATVLLDNKKDEPKSPAPNLSAGIKTVAKEEVSLEVTSDDKAVELEKEEKDSQDLNVINDVTIENPAFSENTSLLNELEDVKKEEIKKEVEEISPLLDDKYEEHPLYKDAIRVFGNVDEKIIDNN